VLGSEAGVFRDVRGSLDTASVTGPGWSCGTVLAESARWIAAADGTEGTECADGVMDGGRLGLASWLFFLDLRPPALDVV